MFLSEPRIHIVSKANYIVIIFSAYFNRITFHLPK